MSDEKVDYAWLAANLNKLRVTPFGEAGLAFFKGRVFLDDILTIIETSQMHDRSIPDQERRRVIRRAVFEAAKAGELTEKSLRAEISKQKSLYKRSPLTDFVLLTSLSVTRPPELRRLSFDGARFIFSDNVPATFSREGLQWYPGLEPPNDMPPGFAVVRASVQARTEHEAFEAAVNSLDYLRGVWNFGINRGRLSAGPFAWFSGPLKPINKIRLGPVHTIHLPCGKPSLPSYWYEPVYPRESAPEELKEWSRVRRNEKRVRVLVARHGYPGFIKQMFVRYARSLDSSDHEASFLKTWSLLESLAVLGKQDKYDVAIDRALFLSANEDYDRRILEHLKDRRNATVHQGESSGENEPLILQLKRFVEELIVFHLRYGANYSSAAEAAQMLSGPRTSRDLEANVGSLKSRLSIAKAALRLRRRVEEPDEPTPDEK
jgi:hypothetical protein